MKENNYANLPVFSQIKLDDVPSDLTNLLQKNISTIENILQTEKNVTWSNLFSVTEELGDNLQKYWSPIQHMSAVVNSSALREVTNTCLPLLSNYYTTLSQNDELHSATLSLKKSDVFKSLTDAQKKTIENDLRDFKLSGVHLPKAEKKQFADLCSELSQLAQKFEENVLDATHAWKKIIEDESMLQGLPRHAKDAAKAAAIKEGVDGWVITLEAPSYMAVMMYAGSRELRREVYEAYVTRASDRGPNAGQWDNTQIMRDIMEKRFALAKLLGFDNYAQYSLQTKMVKQPEEVLAFLHELAEKAVARAKDEISALTIFAKDNLKIEKLAAWDVTYASEKLRQNKYDLSQEDLRPYFPEASVVQGLFDIVKKLYGITVVEAEGVDVWHQDAKCYNLFDDNNTLIAQLYLDLYAREHKRGGAWMDECRVRRRLSNGDLQIPVAYVTCNFNAPVGKDPALFTHDDVVTLFHECGHALQHMLTTVEVGSVSGINGVPWDAVEVASQFFENWAWERDSIDMFAAHYETKELLPDVLYERMQRAKNFQSAMQMVRQLEFALFDFELHMHYNHENKDCIQETLDRVREKVTVVPVPEFNRFQHGFSHIFAGGYAAGYYSYKWAEVMACDAFSLFAEKGIFDQATSQKFKETFLASGGVKEPMDLFVAFRGRKPQVDALLEQSGIVGQS